MQLLKCLLVGALLLIGQLALIAQAPKKVLFVGNSYTYFWNLPQTVELMAAEKGLEMTAHQSTSGGSHWGHHWRGERELTTLSKIKKGDYDAVILQNHSMRAIEAPDSLMAYGQRLAKLIKSTGAKPYLYMTWAREWNPYMQQPIKEKYTELAEKINARIVPVGLAWQRARELRPEFPLYAEDGSHPSSLGTYLTACVFYGVLTNQSPVGLPQRLQTVDKNGEKLYLTIQSKESALFCQKVAEEIINQFND